MTSYIVDLFARRPQLIRSAVATYESCVHDPSYETFYETCRMPDTFQSWFLVCHLHVWMCLVRLKAASPEKDGRFAYKQLVGVFWSDVQQRMHVMGMTSITDIRRNLQHLAYEFYGLTLAYDEGLVGPDTMLAAGLWRNLFPDKDASDPIALAKMVNYVRMQVGHLDSIPDKQLFSGEKFTWLPFEHNIISSKFD